MKDGGSFRRLTREPKIEKHSVGGQRMNASFTSICLVFFFLLRNGRDIGNKSCAFNEGLESNFFFYGTRIILHFWWRQSLPVVLSTISIMHLESRLISRLLNGRTRTATLTDDILTWLTAAIQMETITAQQHLMQYPAATLSIKQDINTINTPHSRERDNKSIFRFLFCYL